MMHSWKGQWIVNQCLCLAFLPHSIVVPMVRKAPALLYEDLPVDVRSMVMDHVIRMTKGSYKTLIRALAALHALDREACGGIWRTTFEKAFGPIPGAVEGETTYCPHLLNVHTWREALLRTWKALNAVPENEKWRWEHISLWGLKGMDARLASLGLIPTGALADLLRARGASVLRYNANLVKSHDLCWVITRVGQHPASEDALLERAQQLIDEGANPAYPAILHRAVDGGSLKALKLILDNGGRTMLQYPLGDKRTEYGQRTPLMCARDPAIVKALLKERADPNHYVGSKSGKLTPLLVAVRARALPVARVLLEAGADPHVRDGRALKDAKKYADEVPEMAALVKRYM